MLRRHLLQLPGAVLTDRARSRSADVAFGGIAVALCLLFLSAVRLAPVADFFFLCLCSLCVAAVVVERGARVAAIAWAAASALSLLFPGIAASIGFVAFFGPYPFAKAWIEGRRGRSRAVAWLLKFALLEAALALAGGLAFGPLSSLLGGTDFLAAWQERLQGYGLLGGSVAAPVAVAVLALAAQLLFVVYDLGLTSLISFYLRRSRPSLPR